MAECTMSYFSGGLCTVSFENKVPLLKIKIENHSFSNIYFTDEMRPEIMILATQTLVFTYIHMEIFL